MILNRPFKSLPKRFAKLDPLPLPSSEKCDLIVTIESLLGGNEICPWFSLIIKDKALFPSWVHHKMYNSTPTKKGTAWFPSITGQAGYTYIEKQSCKLLVNRTLSTLKQTLWTSKGSLRYQLHLEVWLCDAQNSHAQCGFILIVMIYFLTWTCMCVWAYYMWNTISWTAGSLQYAPNQNQIKTESVIILVRYRDYGHWDMGPSL